MLKLSVKRLDPDAKLPVVAHTGEDLGYDIFCSEDFTIEPGEQKKVKTGLAMEHQSVILEVQATHLGAFGPRRIPFAVKIGLIAKQPSGVASKRMIDVKAGVIDAGYRNEIMVLLFNYGKEPQTFAKHDKVAQYVPILCLTGSVIEVEELTDSSRGLAGWGSGHTDAQTT